MQPKSRILSKILTVDHTMSLAFELKLKPVVNPDFCPQLSPLGRVLHCWQIDPYKLPGPNLNPRHDSVPTQAQIPGLTKQGIWDTRLMYNYSARNRKGSCVFATIWLELEHRLWANTLTHTITLEA